MSFDLQKILASKRALRRNLAARPVAEKLRMLDALRERELAIRSSAVHSDSSALREGPAPYRTGGGGRNKNAEGRDRLPGPHSPCRVVVKRRRIDLWNDPQHSTLNPQLTQQLR
jgi:hypothetical protein